MFHLLQSFNSKYILEQMSLGSRTLLRVFPSSPLSMYFSRFLLHSTMPSPLFLFTIFFYYIYIDSVLSLGKVWQNSCRIFPKYGEEHKGEEEGATIEEET